MIPESLLTAANHLWQSTIFAAAAGLLTLAFRTNRAAVRHGLWLAASVKFLVPFSLLAAAAGYLTPASRSTPEPSPVRPVLVRMTLPFAVPASRPPVSQNLPTPNPLPALLAAIWLGGAAVVGYGWSRQWLRMRSAAKTATPLEFDAPIPVRSTATGLEPGVFGIWRPVLLLPEGIARHLTRAQLGAIVIHELCHVRRRDTLTACIQMLVETLFWFHPLVWWIGQRMLEEREKACDEEVLRQTGDAQSYAEAILGVCRLYQATPPCTPGVTGSELKTRIEGVMNYRGCAEINARKKLLLVAASMIVVGLPVIVGTVNAPYLHAQSVPGKRAAFEVISIKPNTGASPMGLGWKVEPGGRFHGSNLPVVFLLAAAYDVPFQSQRLTGIPDWAGAARYDIDAVPEKGAVPPELRGKALDASIRPFLQSLLADRFQLVIRRETKLLPVYAIVRGKGELKLKAATVEEKDCDAEHARVVGCHNLGGGLGRGVHGEAADLDDLALFVSNWTDRPVINRSGITRLFQFDTPGWTPMQARPPRADGQPDREAASLSDPTRPTIFMIFSAMGLKLEPDKGSLDTYVIERIERPTVN